VELPDLNASESNQEDPASLGKLKIKLSLPQISLRPGELCPYCGKGKINYDGCLNLVCSECGITEGGACT